MRLRCFCIYRGMYQKMYVRGEEGNTMCDEKYLYSRKLYVFILLTIMIPLILLNNKSIYAEERSDEGTAYAVLTNSGELIFFRSNDVYSEGAGQTAYDINGTRYYGRIYTEIETLNEELSRNVKWYGNRKSIKEVSVADGQLIRPVNCRYWFHECSNMWICNLKGLDTSRVNYPH